MSNTFGKAFKITTWGESHGDAVGVVIDGCPPGLPITLEDIQKELDRRKPGQSEISTQRKEGDKAEILSGVFEGVSLGTPISISVWNSPNINFCLKIWGHPRRSVVRSWNGCYKWRRPLTRSVRRNGRKNSAGLEFL